MCTSIPTVQSAGRISEGEKRNRGEFKGGKDYVRQRSVFAGRGIHSQIFIEQLLCGSHYTQIIPQEKGHLNCALKDEYVGVKCHALQGGCCWDLKYHRPLGGGEKGKMANLKDGTRWQV